MVTVGGKRSSSTGTGRSKKMPVRLGSSARNKVKQCDRPAIVAGSGLKASTVSIISACSGLCVQDDKQQSRRDDVPYDVDLVHSLSASQIRTGIKRSRLPYNRVMSDPYMNATHDQDGDQEERKNASLDQFRLENGAQEVAGAGSLDMCVNDSSSTSFAIVRGFFGLRIARASEGRMV